ncbi:MAG TPA: 1-acyl-sn-glycerol-3-phosphate acyltransferase [Candidatus Aquabacterium excrementipullorum]|nr:1-acyl-sn-glycerol-3-phosphate acyltransferase [Candidatus Aquabacterium excrementipullorum]
MTRCQAAAALRSLAFGLWMTVTVVPYAVALVLASVVIRGARLYWLAVGWNRMTVWGARAICGIEPRVQGWHHVEEAHAKGQPLVICPKHQSAWETFFLSVTMPRPLSYVFKRELLWIPFFGWALARLDMVHIDRSRRTQAARKVAGQGRRMLDRGNWIILFPEGTRGPRGGQLPYKLGAARLAVDTGTPVLPIAVASGRCWPKSGWLLRPGVIDVSVGAPIPVDGRTPQAVMADVEAWIEAEMRRLDPQAYATRSKATGAVPQEAGGSHA